MQVSPLKHAYTMQFFLICNNKIVVNQQAILSTVYVLVHKIQLEED